MLTIFDPPLVYTVAAVDAAIAIYAGWQVIAAAARWAKKQGIPRAAATAIKRGRHYLHYKFRMARGRLLWIIYSDIIHAFLCVRHLLGERTLPRRRKWLMDLLWVTSCSFLGWYWKIIPLKYFLKIILHAVLAALILFKIPAALLSHPAGRIRVAAWFMALTITATTSSQIILATTQLLATL